MGQGELCAEISPYAWMKSEKEIYIKIYDRELTKLLREHAKEFGYKNIILEDDKKCGNEVGQSEKNLPEVPKKNQDKEQKGS